MRPTHDYFYVPYMLLMGSWLVMGGSTLGALLFTSMDIWHLGLLHPYMWVNAHTICLTSHHRQLIVYIYI